ncbi:MAG TPA: GGDEF domain-containing protein [Thermoanaerobaculia bacterium]|nr:GGDEF domain-containing protein [Thermoanaerobaculia bacterium]
MAVENDPTVRPLVRFFSPGILGPALGAGAVLSLAVLAVWRFAPGLLAALGLLLAWATALAWGLALAARREERTGLAQPAPEERKAPAVSPAPATPAATAVSPAATPANGQAITIRDPLTGLFHRRYFEASLEREIHRMERRNRPLGIILMEVDGFQSFAEARGQGASEALLRMLGVLLNRRVRGGDVASRYDGGTFGLLLPEAPLEGVQTRAEQLRSAVREMREGEGGPLAGITLSLGVAAFPDSGHSSEKLLRAVKAALDDAKTECDCVAVAPDAVLDRRLMLPD